MQTRRTLSNISFNSPGYFELIVKQLLDDGKIDWCHWICHFGESSENGMKKDHIHFVFQPSKTIDTNLIVKAFNEFDPDCPSIPRTCLSKFNFEKSMTDWLLYGIHDPGYLISKGLQREFFYSFDDMHSTDPALLSYEISEIQRPNTVRLAALQDAALRGVPFFELVQNGLVPVNLRSQYEFQYRAIVRAFHLDNPDRIRVDSNSGDVLKAPAGFVFPDDDDDLTF